MGIFSRRTDHTQEVRAFSHDGPIIRRKRGHILTTDQSCKRGVRACVNLGGSLAAMPKRLPCTSPSDIPMTPTAEEVSTSPLVPARSAPPPADTKSTAGTTSMANRKST
eukprot:263473-Prorocentrum_minimum.AAC.3